jgi:hypothetical protein
MTTSVLVSSDAHTETLAMSQLAVLHARLDLQQLVAICTGYWPRTAFPEDDRLVILHTGTVWTEAEIWRAFTILATGHHGVRYAEWITQ